MLNKYSKYLNSEILKENHVKPDPPGVKKLYDTKTYHNDFSKIFNNPAEKLKREADAAIAKIQKDMNDAIAKAKKGSVEIMVEQLKKELDGQLICIFDENGRQKILQVNDVTIGNKGNDYWPVLVEDDGRKFRYNWENDSKSRIFNIGRFLNFFDENYLDQLLQFTGKPLKGGDKMKYVKHVIRIGIHNGGSQDYLITESEDKTQQLLFHQEPIKILDMRLKELDPYGEENWDN